MLIHREEWPYTGARPKSQRERTLPPSLFRHEETKKWHFYFKWFSLGTFSGEIWLTNWYMQPIGPLHWKQQRGKGCMWMCFEDRQSRCKAIVIVTRNSTFAIWLMRWVILPTPILQPTYFTLVHASRLFRPMSVIFVHLITHYTQNGSRVSRIERMPPLLHPGLELCGTSSSQFVSQDLAAAKANINWKEFAKNFREKSTKTPAVQPITRITASK